MADASPPPKQAAKKVAANQAPPKNAAAKAAPAKKAPAKEAPARKAPAKKVAESADDALRRRFREVLEHKHGHQVQAGKGHESGHGPALRSNDKRQQMFRRKSGG
jgi:hypothetical protein